MKKIILFLTVLLFTGTLAEKRAEAAGIYLGALAGYSSMSANNEFGVGNGALGFGLKGGLQFLSSFAIAAEGVYGSTTPSGTTTGFTSNFSMANISVDYILFDIPDRFKIFLGPKFGIAWTSAGGASGSSTAIGGEAGVDFFTSANLSVGGEINFLSVGAPTLNNNVGNTGTLIQVLAAVKYWL